MKDDILSTIRASHELGEDHWEDLAAGFVNRWKPEEGRTWRLPSLPWHGWGEALWWLTWTCGWVFVAAVTADNGGWDTRSPLPWSAAFVASSLLIKLVMETTE